MSLVEVWERLKASREAPQGNLVGRLKTYLVGKLAPQDGLEGVWESLSRCLEEPQADTIRI